MLAPGDDAESAAFELELRLEAAALTRALTPLEATALAVCVFAREFAAGGFGAFLANTSRRHAAQLGDALSAIGCPRLAAIAREADALVRDMPHVQSDVALEDLALRRALADWDLRVEACPEDALDALFAWAASYADALPMA